MAIAVGVSKRVVAAREGTWSSQSTASGQVLRRVSSTVGLTKDAYSSNEILPSMQVRDFRHGTRRVQGQITGELSPYTYSDLLAIALRRDLTAGSSSTMTNIAASSASPNFVRVSGSFLTDGFKLGDIIKTTGWSGAGTANNNVYWRVISVSALQMDVFNINGTGSTVATMASSDSVTMAVVGKKTFIPQSGQTDASFTLEHWFSDLSQSELFTGCKPAQIDIGMPAQGMSTFGMNVLGYDMSTANAAVFGTASAATTTNIAAAVNGVLRLAGSDQVVVTGIQFSLNNNMQAPSVVGRNTVPAIFRGRAIVQGSLTAYFDSVALRNAFINETEVSLSVNLVTTSAVNAPTISFTMPRIKLNSATKDDPEIGISQQIAFQALENVSGGAGTSSEATTISYQDTEA